MSKPKPHVRDLFSRTLMTMALMLIGRVFCALLRFAILTPVCIYTRATRARVQDDNTRARAQFFYTRGRRRAGTGAGANARNAKFLNRLAIGSLLGLTLAVTLGLTFSHPAAATTTSTINFQARLEASDGGIADDGNYNVEFKLYSAASGGSALWTEDYLNTAGHGIRVVNGYLTANLGSITPFPSTIPWDQQLYVTMNIGGTSTSGAPTYDGEMSPRLQLTAVPYAFQAKSASQLQVSSGSNIATLSFTTPTANDSILLPDASGTVCLANSTTCGFATSSGSASYIQNGASLQTSANFHIQSAGTGTVSATVQALAGQTADLLQFQDNSGAAVSGVNASGQFYQQSGSFAGTLTQAALSQNVNYVFPSPGAGYGTATICLSTGNCAGSGGGITGSGSTNYVARFNSASTVNASSLLYDDGTIVGVGATTGPAILDVTPASSGQSSLFVQNAASSTASTALIEAAASQTGNLLTFENSSGGTVAAIDSAGDIATTGTLSVGATASLGTPSATTGSLSFANSTNSQLQSITTEVPTGTGNVIYQLPQGVGGQNYELCTTIGNCAGSGSGATATGGLANYIAKFSAAQAITSSDLFDNGSFVGLGTTTNSGLLSLQGISTTQNTVFAQGKAGSSAATTVLEAASGQSGDLLDLESSSGSVVAKVDTAGNLTTANLATANDTVSGSLGVTGATTLSGTLGVTGNATLSGTLAVTGATTLTGLVTANGGLSVANATTFTNAGSTLNTAVSIANQATGGAIGTAAATVDSATTFAVSQTTTGQTLLLPNPTDTTAGRVVYVTNTGTASFSLYGVTAAPGTTQDYVWNGSAWTVNGSGTTGNYIQNGTTQQATSNFNISGSGTIGGTATISSLAAGLVQSSSSGLLTSGTVDRNSASFFTNALNVANGGTGLSSLTTNSLLYASGATSFGQLTGSAGQLLLDNTSGVPTFTTLTGDASLTGAGVVTVNKLQGNTLTITTPTSGQYLRYNGAAFVNSALQAADISGTLFTLAASSGSSQTVSAGSTVSILSGASGNLTTTAGATNTVTVDIVSNPTFSGTVTASSNGVALAATGAPAASATSSLLQLGSALVGGNNAANGGTYLGINAPSSGAGSAADFLNLQLNGVNKLLVTNAGALATASNISDGGTLSVASTSTFGGLITANGGITTTGETNTGNFAQTGSGSFSTGTGAVSLNGATSVTGSNSFTTGSGTVTLGSLGAGLVQSSAAGVLSSGAVDRNSATLLTNALNVANGGTGLSSLTANSLLYANSTTTFGQIAGTSGQLLLDNASGVPTFTSLGGDASLTGAGVLTVNQLQGNTLTITTPTTGQYLRYNGAAFVNSALQAADISGTLFTLAGSAGTNQTVTAGSTVSILAGSSANLTTTASASNTVTVDIVSNPTFTGTVTSSNSSGTAVAATGTPTASATNALLQLGNTIAGGNSAANGGTYFGINAPNTGAGSAADFLNFEVNNVSKLQVTNSGNLTTAGSITDGGSLSVGTTLAVTGTSTFTGAVTANGGITTAGLTDTGNFLQTGSGTFSTGTGTVTLNGATSVTGSNTFSVGSGASTLGGTLGVAGLTTLSAGLTDSGAVTINGATTLNGATSITGSNSFTTGTGTVTLGSLAGGLVQSSAAGVLSSSAVDRNSATLLTNALNVANGGTGLTSLTTNSLLYANSSTTFGQIAGTSGQLLLDNTSGVPTFTTLSGDTSLTGAGVLTVNKLQGNSLTITTPTSGQYLRYNGSAFVNSALQAGDISGTLFTLAGSTGTNQTVTAGSTVSILAGSSANLTAVASPTNTVTLDIVSNPTFTGTVTAGNLADNGTLSVTGSTTLSGNSTEAGTFGVTGLTTLSGGETVTGTINDNTTGSAATNIGNTGSALNITGNGALAGTTIFSTQVAGDSNPRFTISANGTESFGSGAAASDVNFNRSAASTINDSGNLAVTGYLTVGSNTAATSAKLYVLSAASIVAKFAPGSTTSVGEVVQGYSGQTADLAQFQNSSNAVLSGINASGNFYNQSGSYTGTIIQGTLSQNTTYTIPASTTATDTFCLLTLQNCGAPASGAAGTGYIQNQYAAAQTGNFYLQTTAATVATASLQATSTQSASLLSLLNSSGSVTAQITAGGSILTSARLGAGTLSAYTNTQLSVQTGSASFIGEAIRGSASQTADLAQFQNSSNAVLSGINASGNFYNQSGSYTSTLVQGTLSQNQAITIPASTATTDTICLQTLNNCAVTNGATASGTTNYLAKFTGSSTLGNSLLYDSGSYESVNNGTAQLNNSTFGIQAAASSVGLTVQGASGADVADFAVSSGSTKVSISSAGNLTTTAGVIFSTSTSSASSALVSSTLTNTNSGATPSVASVYRASLNGTTNTNGAGTNVLNGLLLQSVTTTTGNTFNGLSFGSNYTNGLTFADTTTGSILNVAGVSIINGSGIIQNAGFSPSTNYSNLQNVTNLTATGNLAQTGTGTFSTGSGAVTLNGNTSISGVNTLSVGSGAVAFGGSLNVQGVETLGTVGGTAGSLAIASSHAGGSFTLQASTAQANSTTLTLPTDANSSDTVCLQTANNCAVTNAATASGTTNYIAKFTGTSALGNSSLFDNGSGVSVGYTGTSPVGLFNVGSSNQFQVSSAGAVTGGTYNGQTISSAASFTGTVTTASDITDGGNLSVSTAATVGTTLGVTGATTLTGLLTANGGASIGTTSGVALSVKGTSGSDIADFVTNGGGKTIYIDSSGNLNSTSTIANSGNYSSSHTYFSSTANDSNTSATANTLNAYYVALTGTNNTNGTNNLNGLNLSGVTPKTGNTFNGIYIGQGYTNILNYNGATLIDGSGIIQNAALGSSVQYTNITGVGALTSGSIASGFGAISTTNNIATTATVQGGTVNTTGTFTVGGTQIASSNLSDGSNLAKLNATQTFSATNTFGASGTGLAVTNNETVGGTLGVSGLTTLSGGLTDSGATSITGTTSINTTGSANTSIGNSSGTFALASSTLNISAGAVSGVTTLGASGAVTFGSTLSVQGVETLGTIGSTAGNLTIASSNAGGSFRLQTATNQANATTLTLPTDTNSTDTVCLYSLNNCGGAGAVTTVGALDGGTPNANGATISTSTLYLQSASATVPGLVNLVAQSFAGAKTFGGLTTLSGGLTETGAASINTTGTANTAIGNGSGSFSLASSTLNISAGAISGVTTLNTSGTITDGGSLTVTGSGTIGTTLGVTGLTTLSGGLTDSGTTSITGATSINTTGTANTSIGNSTGTFAVTSNALNISNAGAISGVTTIGTSGTITDGGNLSVTGTSTLTGAVTSGTINGQTISSAANFTGTLTVAGASTLNGAVAISGSNTLSVGGSTTLTGNTTEAGALSVQGTETLGTVGTTAGNLIIASSNAGGSFSLQSATNQANATALTLPKDVNSTDTVCLQTVNNCGGAGSVTTIGALDGGTANANGASIASSTLYLQSASASYAGLVNTTTQTFAGAKTFSAALQAGSTLGVTGAATLSSSLTVGTTLGVTGATTLTGLLTANGGEILSTASGTALAVTGTTTDTVSSTTSTSAVSSSITNANTGSGAATTNAYNVNLTGTSNANSSTNYLNGINFASTNAGAVNNNTFTGLQFGTGYNGGILNYGTNNVISSTGLISNYAINGGYSNLTGTGALASGSIVSGFGTISTANTITTTTQIQGGTLQNTGGSFAVNTAGNVTAALNTSTPGATLVCQNASSQLATCANSYETTTTTDFIKNTTSPQSGANFNIDGNGVIGGTLGVTGAVTGGTYNGQTISSAANFSGTLTVATGATVTAGGLTVSAGGATITGNVTINTSGAAQTNIGNAAAAFTLASSGLNVSNSGVLTGITSLTASTAITDNGSLSVQGTTTLGTVGTTAGSLVIASTHSGGSFTLQSNTSQANNTVVSLPLDAASTDSFCLYAANNCGNANSITSIGALDGAAANSNGATDGTGVLYLQSATTMYPGLVNTTTQSFAGSKTFSAALQATSTGNAITIANGSLHVGGSTNYISLNSDGSSTQTYAATGNATVNSLSVTNSASGTGTVSASALGISLTGTNTSGADINYGINLATVAAATNNTFYALSVGSGYTDILRQGSTQLISGAGKLQNAALDSSLLYTNITGVGTVTSGSLAAGFGTININSNITTTANLQGNTLGIGTSSSYANFSVDANGNTINKGYLKVGSANQLAIDSNGNLTTTGTLSLTGTTPSNQVIVSDTPTPATTSSLVQLGGAIVGGNNTVSTGGTYLSINSPASGSGSTADLLDLQTNGAKSLVVATGGNTTVYGTLGVSGAAALSSTLGVTGAATFSGGLTVNTNTNFTQTGSGTFSTGTGTVTLNGATSVTGSNTFSVGSGASTLGGTLSVAGSETLGTAASSAGSLIFTNAGNSKTVTLQALANASTSLSLTIPAETNSLVTSDAVCLQTLQNCSPTGGQIGGTGTVNYVPRYSTASQLTAGTIYDTGTAVSIGAGTNTAGLFSVGTGNAFQVASTGAVTAVGVNSGSGLLQGSGGLTLSGASSLTGTLSVTSTTSLTATGTNALAVSGAPAASSTSALVQLGGTVVGGNSTSGTGGTYFSINEPNTGAGSTADYLNFESNGTSQAKLTNGGNLTLLGNLSSVAGSFSGTITGGSSLTLGTASSAGSVILGNGSNAYTSSIVPTAPASASQTFTLPSTGGTLCTTATCTTGGGSISGGTTNYVARYTSPTALGIGIIYDSGTAVSVGAGTSTAGIFSVGSGNPFQVANTGAVTAVGVSSGSGLIQGTGGLTVSGASANLNVASNFTTNINTGTSTGAVNIGNSAAGLLTLQSGSTIGITGTNFTLNTAGAITAGTYNAQTISSTANFTGSLAVTTSETVGTTLGVSGTITGGSSLTLGTASVAGSLLLGNGSNSYTSAIVPTAPASASQTFTLPAAGGTLCTTATCTTGGGSISGGTTNYVARYTSATALTAGTIYDTGTAVSIGAGTNTAGLFSVGTGNAFQVASTGAVTAVGVNSGSGLLQGSGGLTLSGASSLTGTLSVTSTITGGSSLTLGTSSTAGTIVLATGSNAFTSTLQGSALSAPQTFTLPATGGTICVIGTCTAANINAIPNSTTQSTGNINIISNAIGNVTEVLQAASSATADVLDIYNSSGVKSDFFDNAGDLKVGTGTGQPVVAIGAVAPTASTLLSVQTYSGSGNALENGISVQTSSSSPTGNALVVQRSSGGTTASLSFAGALTLGQLANSGYGGSIALADGTGNGYTDNIITNGNLPSTQIFGLPSIGGTLLTTTSYGANINQNALISPNSPSVSSTGSTYYYAIAAYNAQGTALPGTATGASSSSQTLTWSAAPGATGYYVYRSASNLFTAGTSVSLIGTITSAATLTFTDTGITGTSTPLVNPAGTGLSIQGWNGQTGNLFQATNSAGSVLAKIDASGNLTAGTYNSQTISSTANFTGTVAIQGANALTLGTTGTNTGAIVFKGSTAASGTLTLAGPANPSTSNYTVSLPAATSNDTVCLQSFSNCSGANAGSGDTSYIFNQTTQQASSNFNISGAGVIGTTLTVNKGTTLNGISTGSSTAAVVNTGAASNVGETIQAASSQTANIFQLQDSTSANLTSFDATGDQEQLGYFDSPVGGFGTYGNLLTYSEQLDNTSAWGTANLTVTANAAVAPDGNTTAEQLTTTATGGGIAETSGTATGGTYTFSIWLRSTSGTQTAGLRIDGSTSGIGTNQTVTATTTWQRFSVTQNTAALGGNVRALIYPGTQFGTGTVDAWGAQVVQSTTPQVYVRTTATAIAPTTGLSVNGNAMINGTLAVTSSETVGTTLTVAGTYNTNTFTSTNLTFNGGASTVQAASGSNLTVQTQGAGQLTLGSGSGTLGISAATSTIQRTATGNTTLDLNDTATTTLILKNSGAGVANLDLYGGSLQTGATPVTRLDNSGNLLNIGNITAIGTSLNTGTTTVTAATDGTNIFQVQNASAASAIAIDTNSATNLAQNGGAETSGTFGTYWAAFNGGTVSRGTGTNAESGTAYAQIGTASSGGAKNILSAALTTATTYLVSFSVKGSTPASDLGVSYLPAGTTADATGTGTCSTTMAVTAIYTKVTCTIITATAGSTGSAALAIYEATTGRTLYVDNLSVVPQTAAASTTLNVSQVRIGGVAGQGLTLLTVDSSAAAPTLNTSNSALIGSIYYDTTIGALECYGTSGWGACGTSPNVAANLIPEYSGAVLDGNAWLTYGTNDIGTLTSDLCSYALNINKTTGDATCSTSGQDYNYYKWSSPQTTAQTYSIYVKYQLPANFKSFSPGNYPTLNAYTTSTTANASTGSRVTNGVQFSMYDKSDNLCGAGVTPVTTTANTWQAVNINPTGTPGVCSFAPSDTVTFRIDVTSDNNSAAYVSNLSFLMLGK